MVEVEDRKPAKRRSEEELPGKKAKTVRVDNSTNLKSLLNELLDERLKSKDVDKLKKEMLR